MYHSVLKIYAKQKHLGCKKVRGQSEATLTNRQARPKGLISAEAKKLLYQIKYSHCNLVSYRYSEEVYAWLTICM